MCPLQATPKLSWCHAIVALVGGVGRWDLPGGSRQQLVGSIWNHLLTLPEVTQVYPGHGPVTTIGQEKRSNPYLRE
ncbi:MAG: hypothetical protein OHK005_20970 [Candidatus Methylacidiphilales bacterium]